MLVITTKKEFSMKLNLINTENSVGSVFYTIASQVEEKEVSEV